MNNKNIIESIDANKLGINEIIQIAEVEKDMWAYGIGEYVKCINCGEIHSKNDIFGHLSIDIRNESVTKLEEIISGDNISCKKCNWNTEFIYDIDNNIIDNKSNDYNSDIFYHESVVLDYKNNFSLPIKKFLKKYKNTMREVLVD